MPNSTDRLNPWEILGVGFSTPAKPESQLHAILILSNAVFVLKIIESFFWSTSVRWISNIRHERLSPVSCPCGIRLKQGTHGELCQAMSPISTAYYGRAKVLNDISDQWALPQSASVRSAGSTIQIITRQPHPRSLPEDYHRLFRMFRVPFTSSDFSFVIRTTNVQDWPLVSIKLWKFYHKYFMSSFRQHWIKS